MANEYAVLAINPGSTSTKIAVYKNENCQFETTIRHTNEELQNFARINDQYEFRLELIEQTLAQHSIAVNELSAVVGRGGPLKALDSGTYIVNEMMCEDLRIGIQTEHASNLGGLLARAIADQAGVAAFIVDPVSVDELQPLARISGLPQIKRRSLFHALNLKSAAHRAAKELGRDYHELTLLLIHLGGGISVGVQQRGKMIDVANPNESGPFSPERAGALPTGDLIKLCYSGQYTLDEMKKLINGNAGLVAYLGSNDGREIEHRITAGDEKAALIYEAMAYQVAKEVGAMAAVVNGKADAIVLTGGLAHSRLLVDWITKRVQFIAGVLVYPGEDELRALVEGTLRVLRGEEPAKLYQ